MAVILFIVILLVLIIGHELGHFFAAKWAGMKVPEFGIGFPPRLWGKKFGDTEYTINALPFGGFVKIVGEDSEDQSDPNAFGRKSRLAQAITLLAGVGMNVVLGFVAFWIAFMIGVPTVIGPNVPPQSIDGARVVVTTVVAGSPAAATDIAVGDEVRAIARGAVVYPIARSEDIAASLNGEEPIVLTVVRDGQELQLPMTPVVGVIPEEPERAALGVASILVGTTKEGPLAAAVHALTETGTALRDIVVGLVSLIGSALTFQASLEDVSGPVGIAGLVGDASVFGAGQVLVLASVISLNLAVINLLPFPALDGGRLALLAYETLRRRAVAQVTVQVINAAGFVLLIALMLAVTYNDIARLLA